jgi:hypothetical protein
MTVPGLEPGISPVTHDLQCQTSKIAGDQVAESFMAMGWAAALAAISRANRPLDPASMGMNADIPHGRCIAVRVLPFACRADVRPEISYTEDARGPRSATEKSVHVTRGGVADRGQVPMAQPRRISVALSGSPTSSVIKLKNESTNHAICTLPPGGETTHFSTTRTTRPIPVITRRKLPPPCRPF